MEFSLISMKHMFSKAKSRGKTLTYRRFTPALGLFQLILGDFTVFARFSAF